MSTLISSLLFLALLALGSCALSSPLNPSKINSVLTSPTTSLKEASLAESKNPTQPKTMQDSKPAKKVAVPASTPVDEKTVDAKESAEEGDDHAEDVQEDMIQEEDAQDEEGSADEEQQDDEEEEEEADQDDQEDNGPADQKRADSKESKTDSKEAASPKEEGKIEDLAKQANTMVGIIHILDGKKAYSLSPAGLLTLNFQWLKKEGGEAGEKLVRLVEDDKKAMAGEVDAKSDAIFLKEGILSFKVGLRDDQDQLNKKWVEGGKKDKKLKDTVEKIEKALGKVEGVVQTLETAIKAEKNTKSDDKKSEKAQVEHDA